MADVHGAPFQWSVLSAVPGHSITAVDWEGGRHSILIRLHTYTHTHATHSQDRDRLKKSKRDILTISTNHIYIMLHLMDTNPY